MRILLNNKDKANKLEEKAMPYLRSVKSQNSMISSKLLDFKIFLLPFTDKNTKL